MITDPSHVAEIVYPESDGQPMAENTEQFRWIVTFKENLEALYADRPDVFVAGDLLWYPVEGRPDIRRAPDALVAFGRPKGRRGAYLQWREGGIAPQVVFEVLSPGNTTAELQEKRVFYEQYGVAEYYIYDPDENRIEGWLRQGKRLVVIEDMAGWVSPRLGIRFVPSEPELLVYRPDGQRFLTFVEQIMQVEEERQRAEEQQRRAEEQQRRAEEQQRRAEEQQRRAEEERQRAEEAERRLADLEARMRLLGIDPGA